MGLADDRGVGASVLDRFKYDNCCWSGSHQVDQTLEGNILELSAECDHSCAEDEKEIRDLPNGSRSDPVLEEAECTADLAYSRLVAFSCFVICTQSLPLHVPRAPTLQEVGSRLHGHRQPRRILRADLMCSSGVCLVLRPPRTSPGPGIRQTTGVAGVAGVYQRVPDLTASVRHLRLRACAADVATWSVTAVLVKIATPIPSRISETCTAWKERWWLQGRRR